MATAGSGIAKVAGGFALVLAVSAVLLKLCIHVSNDALIQFSAEHGYTGVVKTLIYLGADVHADHDAAVHLAADNGHSQTLGILIDHGADIKAIAGTILLRAINSGNAEMVKLVLERSYMANNLSCGSPLMQVAERSGKQNVIDVMDQHINYAMGKCTPDGRLIPSAEDAAKEKQFAAVTHLYQGADASEEHKYFGAAADTYKQAADLGYAPAQNDLGILYGKGQGVKQDYAEALKWFQKSADQGYEAGEYNLAYAYDYGLGTRRDYPKAAQYYQKAADHGYADAYGGLANLYFHGRGVPQSSAKAIELYDKASHNGMEESASHIAFIYQYGLGVPRDLDAAIKWYEVDANQGDVNAIAILGWIYLKGDIPDGKPKALALYEKAAGKDVVIAYDALGMMYLYGLGVAQDAQKALQWYLKAADKADDIGRIQAAWILGNYDPRDYRRAFDLLNHARGSPVALNNIAYMYEHGLGISDQNVPASLHKAFLLYKAAADQCYGQAMFHVGHFYETGLPAVGSNPAVPTDLAEARRWMQKGAGYGSPAAAKWLVDHPAEGSRELSDSKTAPLPEIGFPPQNCKKG